jgi:sirohydrochlorin ferrochelatase
LEGHDQADENTDQNDDRDRVGSCRFGHQPGVALADLARVAGGMGEGRGEFADGRRFWFGVLEFTERVGIEAVKRERGGGVGFRLMLGPA